MAGTPPVSPKAAAAAEAAEAERKKRQAARDEALAQATAAKKEAADAAKEIDALAARRRPRAGRAVHCLQHRRQRSPRRHASTRSLYHD